MDWIAITVFWVLVILGMGALVGWIAAQGYPTSRSLESALEILRRRYARSEITEEDFKRMKENILRALNRSPTNFVLFR